MAKLLIKFPSRSRPARFMEVFGLYKSMLSGKHDVKFLFSFDEDDVTMNNPGIHTWVANQGESVRACWGHSASKIEAVNADMQWSGDWDILLLASDDMIPMLQNYDDNIVSNMQKHFPDYDGVLHYNDDRQKENINTLCILGRKYYNQFGYIYNPEYKSVYADNEFTDVSRMLHKVVYIDEVIIRHYWMELGVDALYIRNEDKRLYERDQSVYAHRKANNFGLKHANAS